MTDSAAAWILLLMVAAYACGGDYGAGFWDLCAGGVERGQRPRWLIDQAMEPVWEVSNVWLILIVIMVWTGFPAFLQTVFSALWLPLALALIGLVLRRAGFAFRKPTRSTRRRVYGAGFALASLLTPFFFGVVIGAVASDRVVPGTIASDYAWADPVSVVVGLLAVGATAFLGATFLTADAHRFGAHDLVGYFRARAWGSLAAIVVLTLIGLALPHDHVRHVHHGLIHGIGLLLVILAWVAAVATAWLVAGPEAQWARYTSVTCVALTITAWGFAQRPYPLPTSSTVRQAAGAGRPLQWLLFVALIALVLVGPAIAALYRLDTHGAFEPQAGAEADADAKSSP